MANPLRWFRSVWRLAREVEWFWSLLGYLGFSGKLTVVIGFVGTSAIGLLQGLPAAYALTAGMLMAAATVIVVSAARASRTQESPRIPTRAKILFIALRGEESMTWLGNANIPPVTVARYLHLLNTGESTVLKDWNVTVTLPGGQAYQTSIVDAGAWDAIKAQALSVDHAGTPVIQGNTLPVPTNRAVEATIAFVIPELAFADIPASGTHVTVSCVDGFGDKWTFEGTMRRRIPVQEMGPDLREDVRRWYVGAAEDAFQRARAIYDAVTRRHGSRDEQYQIATLTAGYITPRIQPAADGITDYVRSTKIRLDATVLQQWAAVYAEMLTMAAALSRYASAARRTALLGALGPWQDAHAKLKTLSDTHFRVNKDLPEVITALAAVLGIDEANYCHLTITMARYHVPDAPGAPGFDVRDRLRVLVKAGRLRIRADNNLAGDPAPGKLKRLDVTYECMGIENIVSVTEGDMLELP